MLIKDNTKLWSGQLFTVSNWTHIIIKENNEIKVIRDICIINVPLGKKVIYNPCRRNIPRLLKQGYSIVIGFIPPRFKTSTSDFDGDTYNLTKEEQENLVTYKINMDNVRLPTLYRNTFSTK